MVPEWRLFARTPGGVMAPPASSDPLAVRMAAAPGSYFPADRPELSGALYPLSSGRYTITPSSPAPAGCAWVADGRGGTDLVVQQSGVEVTHFHVPNGRVRGTSNVANVWVHDGYAMGGPTPGGGNKDPYPLVQSGYTGGTGWVVEDVTAVWDAGKRTVDSYGVHLRSGTVRRCYIEGAVDGIVIYGDDCTVEANLVPSTEWYATDPRQTDPAGAHSDGLQDEGGLRHRIVGNDFFSHPKGSSGAIFTQNIGTYDDLLVDLNRFQGAVTLTVIGSEKGKGAFKNFRYTRNVHGRQSSEGQRGAGVAIFDAATFAAMTKTGNTFTDGAPMAVRSN